MPNKLRNGWGGYYRTPTAGKDNLLMGCEVYHRVHCGVFTLDNVEYNLMFLWFDKDLCPDTQGVNQESFDMSADDADVILAHLGDGVGSFLPCVAPLLEQDMIEGLSTWEIMEKRVGVLVWHFMGFTFQQVVDQFPILVETTDDEGNKSVNLKKCSLEDNA